MIIFLFLSSKFETLIYFKVSLIKMGWINMGVLLIKTNLTPKA